MQPLFELVRHVEGPAAFAADLLISSVWKASVLIAVVALFLRCLPRLSAALRSAVWTAVLLAVLFSPLFLLNTAAAKAPAPRGLLHAGAGWSLLLVAVWGVFSCLRLLQLAASALRLRAIARRATPIAPDEAMDTVLRGSARRIELCVSPDVDRPSVTGFIRSRILLPTGLLAELSSTEMQHVLLHEMEHLRRRDDWANLLQKLSLALFPLHPALLWLDRRLCRERELACDDRVLRVTQARKAYAACLARLAEDSMMRRGISLALGLLGVDARLARRSELSSRVQRILCAPSAGMGRVPMAVSGGLLFAMVAAGPVLLARCPQLISFGTLPSQETAQLREAVQRGQAPATLLTATVRRAPESLSKALLVKAVMPSAVQPAGVAALGHRVARPASRFQAVIAPSRPEAQPLRRIALSTPFPQTAAPYVIYTEWHSTEASAHASFAVAEQERPAEQARPVHAVAQQISQTYAAVPVQGGWLLIEL